MTGDALFFSPLFRRVLRHLGDRRAVARARCSEHEVVRDVLPDHGTTFDLAAVARELRAEEPYLREGQTARTLIRPPDLRIVVVALKRGKTISEHHANVTASVQTLSGHVRLRLAERSVDVPEGQLLVMGAGLPHDVYAETDSTFLLTLGRPASN